MNHRDTETQRREEEGIEERKSSPGRPGAPILPRLSSSLLVFSVSLCLCGSLLSPAQAGPATLGRQSEVETPLFNPLLPHPEPTAAGAVGLAGTSSVGPWGLLAML